MQLIPGWESDWGFFLLSAWRFYIRGESKVDALLDYRTQKGFATGADFNYHMSDFGMDGQPNTRIHSAPKGSSAPSKRYVWIDDGWHQLVEKDGADQVEIDGVWRKVDHVDVRNGYVHLVE